MSKEKKLLAQYAEENNTIIRTMNDLSPLELWLLRKLSEQLKNNY